MKISFPHMGTPIGYKKLFELLGHDVIVPPAPSQRTIDLGVKYSPEFACFPLKVLLGTYIEALETGADTIFSSGGHGPCRAGFYGELHSRILKNLGYEVEVVIFDAITRDFTGFYRNLQKLKGKNSWLQLARAVKIAYHVIKSLDYFEKQIQSLRAYELKAGDCNLAWAKIQSLHDAVYSMQDLAEAQEKAAEIIKNIKTIQVEEANRLRIGIIGEIYVVMEPSVNMHIEERLGALGAEVRRSQYLSEWIDFNLIPPILSKSHEKEILKKGEKYIQIIIGGHAKQSVGHIVDFKEQCFDGIVHLMPFACLPELITQSIVPRISKELDIPVLTISLDEQTGIANNLTRLEAFIDLIKNKKLGRIA